MNQKGEIVIYQTADGETSIDVKLENETVWLTQGQMAVLFDKNQSVIARHIRNALTEGEIGESNMQKMHNTISKYKPTTIYNLDVIISVGYRVHSQRGVQFRRWANSVLKDYLIKGYAVRNDLIQQKYDNLKALVDVMGRTMGYLDSPADDQIRSIFDVVKDYTYALDTLDNYDYKNLGIRSTSKEYFHATYENAMGEGSIFPQFHRPDLSDLGRHRPLPFRRGKSRDVALSCRQKSLFHRWE